MSARRLASVLMSLALLAIVGTLAAADTPPPRALTFVDEGAGLSLTIQTAEAASDAGHFVFRVPGLGSYVGQAASGLRVLTPTSVVLHYSGPATLRPAIAPDGSLTGSVREPAAVTVDLQAQIDPAHHTAEATLRDGGRRYHLVVPAVGENGLEATLDAVEAAFVADDPLALYPYTSGDLRAAYSATAFADTWRAQSATIGRVTAMRRTALSEPQTNDLGFVFVIASYEVDRVKPDGSTATASFDVYFVREGGTWNLLFSRAR